MPGILAIEPETEWLVEKGRPTPAIGEWDAWEGRAVTPVKQESNGFQASGRRSLRPRHLNGAQDAQKIRLFVRVDRNTGVDDVQERDLLARHVLHERERRRGANGPQKIRLRALERIGQIETIRCGQADLPASLRFEDIEGQSVELLCNHRQ